MSMAFALDGRVAVVTGGIGLGMAQGLVDHTGQEFVITEPMACPEARNQGRPIRPGLAGAAVRRRVVRTLEIVPHSGPSPMEA